MTELRNLLAGAAGVLFGVKGTITVAVSGHATATAGLALGAWLSQASFRLGVVAAAGSLATFIVQVAQARPAHDVSASRRG